MQESKQRDVKTHCVQGQVCHVEGEVGGEGDIQQVAGEHRGFLNVNCGGRMAAAAEEEELGRGGCHLGRRG